MAETRYWAKRGKRIAGPAPTRSGALALFRMQFSLADRHTQIMTGYGSDGPWFDIQWADYSPPRDIQSSED